MHMDFRRAARGSARSTTPQLWLHSAIAAQLIAATFALDGDQVALCKPLDDGSLVLSCSSYCNEHFASTHCLYCGCSRCTWCPERSKPPKPTAGPNTKTDQREYSASIGSAVAPVPPKAKLNHTATELKVEFVQQRQRLACKPLETGESFRSCAGFCKPNFAQSHCKYCACSECANCDPSTPLPPRPPPSPPPPPPRPRTPIERIDAWWRNGRPSNVLTEAGVLVRQLDELNRKGFVEWVPCPDSMWCGKFGKIWPSSIINRDFNQALYTGTPGARREEPSAGFVLAPPPANRFFCIFPSDGNSMGGIQDESAGHAEESHACGESCDGHRVMTKTAKCSYPPEALGAALEANVKVDSRFKYTEVIVDALRMKSLLPSSLLGVFYMDDRSRANAVRIHGEFLAAFKGRVTAESFPLMAFSLRDGFRAG